MGTNPTQDIAHHGADPHPPSQPATQADCHPWNDTPTSFLPESWGGRGAKASLACMCPGGEVGIAWAAATWAPALSLLLLFPPASHSHLCREEKVSKHSRVLLFSPKLHPKAKLASDGTERTANSFSPQVTWWPRTSHHLGASFVTSTQHQASQCGEGLPHSPSHPFSLQLSQPKKPGPAHGSPLPQNSRLDLLWDPPAGGEASCGMDPLPCLATRCYCKDPGDRALADSPTPTHVLGATPSPAPNACCRPHWLLKNK